MAGLAGLFLGGVMRFIVEHSVLRPPAAASFLASDFFDARTLGVNETFLPGLDLVEQQAARKKAV